MEPVSTIHRNLPPTETTVNVTFIGHAGLAIQAGDSTIIMDPWLSGAIFNDGWDLLVPSVLQPEVLDQATHVWISHEHPDHFHPPSLRMIRKSAARSITLLFQPTVDHRVTDWARAEGFCIQVVDEGQWTPLTTACRVLLGKVGLYDSWLAVEHHGQTFLNLNDCVFATPSYLDRIAGLVGPVDCLMAQFSYASWMGNPDEITYRSVEAQARSKRFADTIDRLHPQLVIPAASFSWFSHEENSYLNDLRVRPREAVRLVQRTGATPVLLVPGETWPIGSPHDNKSALAHYEEAWDISDRPFHHSASVPLAELVQGAESFVERLKSKNNCFLMWVLRAPPFRVVAPVTLWLTDLSTLVRFDPANGLEQIPSSGDMPTHAVELHSSSLQFAFDHEWGVDTLNVNGRYRADLAGPDRLNRAFWFAVLNNAGRYVRWSEVLDRRFATMAIRRLRSAVTKQRT